MHARKNRFENEVRKGTIQGTMGTFTRPAWQVGAGEAQQVLMQRLYKNGEREQILFCI